MYRVLFFGYLNIVSKKKEVEYEAVSAIFFYIRDAVAKWGGISSVWFAAYSMAFGNRFTVHSFSEKLCKRRCEKEETDGMPVSVFDDSVDWTSGNLYRGVAGTVSL